MLSAALKLMLSRTPFFQLVAAKYDNDTVKMRQLSIIEEEGGKRINMAHLVNPLHIQYQSNVK